MPFDVNHALAVAFATNNRINRYLIENVPAEVWSMPMPNKKGRKIAAIVAHVHNVRLMWLKAAGRPLDKLEKLEGDTCAPKDAIKALEASAKAIGEMLDASLASDGKIKGFKPDVASFFAYLIAHDAHHRGQIMMLARQLGSPVSQSVGYGLWEWGTR